MNTETQALAGRRRHPTLPEIHSPPSARAAAAPARRVRPGEPGLALPGGLAGFRTAASRRADRGRLAAVGLRRGAGHGRLLESSQRAQGIPYYLGDEPGLTQTLGWVGAWTSRPSVYAVAAKSAADVAAAVNFARDAQSAPRRQRRRPQLSGIVQCRRFAAHMDAAMRDMSCTMLSSARAAKAGSPPDPAVSVGAGASGDDVYHEVTTKAGRYVQGGGCPTVGVAGLIQRGGFGSFSKAFGLGAASLLEAEIVTADGGCGSRTPFRTQISFWALKGRRRQASALSRALRCERTSCRKMSGA